MRNSRADVVSAAGRLFAERGYHGTSMRDLGRELGLHGSSLYSHIESKEELLVKVVEQGAELFSAAAAEALDESSDPTQQLRRLIAGHVDVVLDNLDVARTFLNEARALDGRQRQRVVDARNAYEKIYRDVLRQGTEAGDFRAGLDPSLGAIFVLSIVNAVDRWYSPSGRLSRSAVVEELFRFVLAGLTG